MNKYFKKFSVMFVMALILSLGFCISAFADDGGVAGTANLNNTAQNSAKVGNKLTAPEIGWKRYDDANNKISYLGSKWAITGDGTQYCTYAHFTSLASDKAVFKFYGTKIRMVSNVFTNKASQIQISIDGNKDIYSENSSGANYIVTYQKTGLSLGIHYVEIQGLDSGLTGGSLSNLNNMNWDVDAIDIDDTGYLIDANESISLNNSTMDLNVGDSQQLTATTTPAGAQVTWTSSDTSIATVDSTGNVTGINEGTCTITATNPDGLTATCIVNVTPKDSEPTDPSGGNTDPTEPTGDANLYIELVDGQIKQYSVSSDEINKFTDWYENRDNDHSLPATYKFTKGSYTDYVVQNQIDWFEVR